MALSAARLPAVTDRSEMKNWMVLPLLNITRSQLLMGCNQVAGLMATCEHLPLSHTDSCCSSNLVEAGTPCPPGK
jgi:hypothetical protein